MEHHTLIIGAGVAGLAAARFLQDCGQSVLLLDKGRGVGGRVATRRDGDRNAPRARWDHGAQFATFRSQSLIARLQKWNAYQVLTPWTAESHRMISAEGLNAFAKTLAKGLDLKNGMRTVHLSQTQTCWQAQTETNEIFEAKNLLCTLPAPQLLDLFAASDLSFPEEEQLRNIQYHRALTLLAELDGLSGIPHPGFLQPQSGILHTVTDQCQKGISPAHTITAHAAPAFSLEWYDRDRNAAASVMRAALAEIIESKIIATQIHGWKFAEPYRRCPLPCLKLAPGLYAAGDGFMAGDEDAAPDLPPRVESAILSGLAAAEKIA
ncbi:MAG: FAD-dependent oxidoreductase [Verrucomicrobia bacterium]|nr:FAD-dependent oxidoreductase [Verrucomicrobiota bacterium]MCH8513059.1 FAD-dependent oxidoreductase [Kiritimatiellia bacterium]